MMRGWNDLREAILHGAVKRLRPEVMTVGVMFTGLVPIMGLNPSSYLPASTPESAR